MVLDSLLSEPQVLIPNTAGIAVSPRISPDGKRVAICKYDDSETALIIINLEDSSEQVIIEGARLRPRAWSTDGNLLYTWDRRTDPGALVTIDSKNGNILETVKLPFDRINETHLDVTTDAQTLVCSREEDESDIWLIENFDPDIK